MRAGKKQKTPAPSLANYFFALFFIFVWLTPLFYVGFTQKGVPFASNYFNNLYRAACLFTKSVKTWSDYYFEIRLSGEDIWYEEPESNYTEMFVFGYRTRFHRIISRSQRDKKGFRQRQELATFIKKRFEQLHPDRSKVEAVRFKRVVYRVGEELAAQKGHWKKPKLSELSLGKPYEISIHHFSH